MSLALPAAFSQPSGGPYGPLQLHYDLPEVEGKTYFVAPQGAADADGNSVEAPTTIEAAIARVETGDAIVLRGGVYRTGDLMLNQGITLQPYQDELPALKGTREAEEWETLRDGLWRIKWDTLFPMGPADWWRRSREAARTPIYLFNNDMVFVDGKSFRQVGWPGEIDESAFSVDYEEGYIYIGVDPADKLVEITAFDNALTRVTGEAHGKQSDKIGPKVHGITFTQYAYRAIEIEGYNPEGLSPESEHGKDVVGTLFENCTISHCSRVGGYFRGDGLTIRNCLVSDTSTEGIFILSSNDVLLERNIITRNNFEGITGYFASAVKIFNQCYRVVCRDNLVIDNKNSSGIWWDVGNVDAVFVNNWIQNTDNGFFFEISQGAICAGNVFVDCNRGVRVLNAAGARVYQNTFVNSLAEFERTERSAVADHFGWHPSTGPDVDERHSHAFMGNLMYADSAFEGPLLSFEQPAALRERLTEPQVDALDYNVYARAGRATDEPLIVWSPSITRENLMELESPAALHLLHDAFEGNSEAFVDYNGPVFQGKELSRFDLSPDFAGSKLKAKLPDEAYQTLGWKQRDVTFPGAFPTAR